MRKEACWQWYHSLVSLQAFLAVIFIQMDASSMLWEAYNYPAKSKPYFCHLQSKIVYKHRMKKWLAVFEFVLGDFLQL